MARITNEELIKEFFIAIDSGDFAALESLLDERVCVQPGAGDPVIGRDAVLASARNRLPGLVQLRHDVTLVTSAAVDRELVVAEVVVHYTFSGPRFLDVLCCGVFRIRRARIEQYRLYIDTAPIAAMIAGSTNHA